jgi:hypothetical protein
MPALAAAPSQSGGSTSHLLLPTQLSQILHMTSLLVYLTRSTIAASRSYQVQSDPFYDQQTQVHLQEVERKELSADQFAASGLCVHASKVVKSGSSTAPCEQR